MNEKRPLISAENQQTVLAVCFVLSLLGVVFNFYNHTRINRVIGASTRMNNINVEQIQTNLNSQAKALSALEKRVADMDGRMNAPPPPPQPATSTDTTPKQ